jgi:broad specificity phosphatase PhoE
LIFSVPNNFFPSIFSTYFFFTWRNIQKKPLTQQGIYQAKAANGILDKFPFWRYYTSDLKRCQKTAKLILGLEEEEEESEYDGESDDLKVIHTPSYQVNNNSNNDENNQNQNQNNNVLILDERLRERAKGVREGRDKTLTYDEAFELYRLERAANNEHDESMWKLPLLELENEVWERVQDWIEEIVQDAYRHHLKLGPISSSNSNNSQYDVFAVTHSGTLRIMIERMVGKQLPKDVDREETDKDGVNIGRLSVPNTSITRIDIVPGNPPSNSNNDDEYHDGQSLNINVQ